MDTKKDLLQHFNLLRTAVGKVGAEAYLDIKTFKVKVHFGEVVFTLHPHFIVFTQGQKQYTNNFSTNVRLFIGWRPYLANSVHSFTDKLVLKQKLLAYGILTPKYSTSAACTFENMVVKQKVSTFGEAIRGPFRKASDTILNLDKGEYYESFISGYIAKIWYWNGEFVCLEKQSMPAIIGDGKRAIGEILDTFIKSLTKHDQKMVNREEITQVLDFYESSRDHVLADGERQIVDIKYGSKFAGPIEEITLNDEEVNLFKLKQLKEIGETLWGLIKNNTDGNFVFTVDAILDNEARFWILEANANPFIHPGVYDPMMRSLAESDKVKRGQKTIAESSLQ